jgi:hypothetical protein
MIFVSTDQSCSHCAIIVWENNKPIDRIMVKTGSSWSKTKSKNVNYFEIITEQLNYVSNIIVDLINKYDASKFVMESPSQGSYGDAKATLITLFRTIEEHIITKTKLERSDISSYAPTKVKSYARDFLPKSAQGLWVYKFNRKTDRLEEVLKKRVIMEKKHMVRACNLHSDNWLEGITKAAGQEDYADAYWIGQMYINGVIPTKKKEK